MEVDKNNIHKVLKGFESQVNSELYTQVNQFRSKISLLIAKTPTSELRNEYTDINILFEQILDNYSFLLKNK